MKETLTLICLSAALATSAVVATASPGTEGFLRGADWKRQAFGELEFHVLHLDNRNVILAHFRDEHPDSKVEPSLGTKSLIPVLCILKDETLNYPEALAVVRIDGKFFVVSETGRATGELDSMNVSPAIVSRVRQAFSKDAVRAEQEIDKGMYEGIVVLFPASCLPLRTADAIKSHFRGLLIELMLDKVKRMTGKGSDTIEARLHAWTVRESQKLLFVPDFPTSLCIDANQSLDPLKAMQLMIDPDEARKAIENAEHMRQKHEDLPQQLLQKPDTSTNQTNSVSSPAISVDQACHPAIYRLADDGILEHVIPRLAPVRAVAGGTITATEFFGYNWWNVTIESKTAGQKVEQIYGHIGTLTGKCEKGKTLEKDAIIGIAGNFLSNETGEPKLRTKYYFKLMVNEDSVDVTRPLPEDVKTARADLEAMRNDMNMQLMLNFWRESGRVRGTDTSPMTLEILNKEYQALLVEYLSLEDDVDLDFVAKDDLPAVSSYNRGNALGKSGRWEEAITEYTKAVELDPIFSLAYYNRGVAYFSLGQLGNAKKNFEEMLTLNPSDDRKRQVKELIRWVDEKMRAVPKNRNRAGTEHSKLSRPQSPHAERRLPGRSDKAANNSRPLYPSLVISF